MAWTNWKAVAAGIVVATTIAACGGGDGDGSGGLQQPDASAPLSVVVIGDSIASGEGLDYGYTY